MSGNSIAVKRIVNGDLVDRVIKPVPKKKTLSDNLKRLAMFIGQERKGYWKHIVKTESYRDDFGNVQEETHEYDVFYSATDTNIFQQLNDKQRERGKPLYTQELFRNIIRVFEKMISDFPPENKPRTGKEKPKVEKLPLNRSLEYMDRLKSQLRFYYRSPCIGVQLDRCPEWEGDELKPEERKQRNPYGAKERKDAESYVKHLDHFGPVWVSVNGRIKYLADNLSEGIAWAESRKYEKFVISQLDLETDIENQQEFYISGPSTTV